MTVTTSIFGVVFVVTLGIVHEFVKPWQRVGLSSRPSFETNQPIGEST